VGFEGGQAGVVAWVQGEGGGGMRWSAGSGKLHQKSEEGGGAQGQHRLNSPQCASGFWVKWGKGKDQAAGKKKIRQGTGGSGCEGETNHFRKKLPKWRCVKPKTGGKAGKEVETDVALQRGGP